MKKLLKAYSYKPKKLVESYTFSNAESANHSKRFIELPPSSLQTKNLKAYVTPGELAKRHPVYSTKAIDIKVQKLQIHVQQLKDRIYELQRHKDELVNVMNIVDEVERMHEEYSKLSKETVNKKLKERKAFENYANAYQEHQRALVDTKQEMSHQKLRIKLLHETLEKRSKEANKILKKRHQLVIKYLSHRKIL